MATGPEHYRTAENLLANAQFIVYEDDSDDVGPRESYETEDEWFGALEYSNKAHRRAIREAAMLATMAQAHATLALAAATALQVRDTVAEYEAWQHAAGTAPAAADGGAA